MANGGSLSLGGGSTLTGAGVFGVTVNGTSGSGGVSGPGTTLSSGSTLSVTTIGSPAVGTVFTPFGGPVSGTFSTLSFGPAAYAVTYPSGAVRLTTAGTVHPGRGTARPQGEHRHGHRGAGQHRKRQQRYRHLLGHRRLGRRLGHRSGDGQCLRRHGTVTGSHTYTAPGTHTVTTTLANTDGTTLVTTEAVTVTGPTITGFSKTVIKPGQEADHRDLRHRTRLQCRGNRLGPVGHRGVGQGGQAEQEAPNPTLKLKLSAPRVQRPGRSR